MESNINPDEIQSFLQRFPSSAYGYGQPSYFDNGNAPGWAPRVTDHRLLDSAAYSQFDEARSEYTTSTATSLAYTMTSAAPSSMFSYKDDVSSVGRSSVPSEGVPHPTFAQQFGVPSFVPPRAGQILWCEFSELKHCRAIFRLDDEAGWIQHHVRHLRDRFPRRLVCWFCDYHLPFDAASPAEGYANFELRMQHIREHILSDHRLTSEDTRPDFHVVEHLYRNGLLDAETYKGAMSFDETPSAFRLPGARRPSSSSQRPLGHQSTTPRDRGQYHDLDREKRSQRGRPGRGRRH